MEIVNKTIRTYLTLYKLTNKIDYLNRAKSIGESMTIFNRLKRLYKKNVNTNDLTHLIEVRLNELRLISQKPKLDLTDLSIQLGVTPLQLSLLTNEEYSRFFSLLKKEYKPKTILRKVA